MMKKLSKLLLVLAIVATVITLITPCPVCEELKANGTPEELEQHILEEHDGIDPYGIHFPGEG